jgi:hypothetical protein
MPTVTVCPTPAGLGARLRYAMVGKEMLPALAKGVACDAIESMKNITIVIAVILFFRIFIFLFSLIHNIFNDFFIRLFNRKKNSGQNH